MLSPNDIGIGLIYSFEADYTYNEYSQNINEFHTRMKPTQMKINTCIHNTIILKEPYYGSN